MVQLFRSRGWGLAPTGAGIHGRRLNRSRRAVLAPWPFLRMVLRWDRASSKEWAVVGAPATAGLLMALDHLDAMLGLVVVEGDSEVGRQAQHVGAVGFEAGRERTGGAERGSVRCCRCGYPLTTTCDSQY